MRKNSRAENLPGDHRNSIRSRPVSLGLLMLIVVLGLASRRFGGSLPEFIAANAGDTLWTIAVFLTLAIAFPGWTSLRLGLVALAISFCVELSQLIDTAWLRAIRGTLVGALLLGQGFLWIDLLRYLVGATLATILDSFWMARVSRKRSESPNSSGG